MNIVSQSCDDNQEIFLILQQMKSEVKVRVEKLSVVRLSIVRRLRGQKVGKKHGGQGVGARQRGQKARIERKRPRVKTRQRKQGVKAGRRE